MKNGNRRTLLLGVCDFGWGSLGKLRLILDRLPGFCFILYGDAGINDRITELLGSRHRFEGGPPEKAGAALVINDPAAANRIADLGIPVIYVDSLPYLWATSEEVPERHKITRYCAQRFPSKHLQVSSVLRDWHEIHWTDPIVPGLIPYIGGGGVVINFGGLHSHLVGSAVDAYLSLVLIPLVEELGAAGYSVSAVCGNLPHKTCQQVRDLLPGCAAIGRLSPYDFEAMLQSADLLFTSPGSTTILQAIALRLPTMLLPPQNLSQRLNAPLFSLPGASIMGWPASVMTAERIKQLRPMGEDAVLAYFYRAICDAAASDQKSAEVGRLIRSTIRAMPETGVLDHGLVALGVNGAQQVASQVEDVISSSGQPRRPQQPPPGAKANRDLGTKQ